MPSTVCLQSGGRMTEIRPLMYIRLRMSAPSFEAQFANQCLCYDIHIFHVSGCVMVQVRSLSLPSSPLTHTLKFTCLIVCGGRLYSPAISA